MQFSYYCSILQLVRVISDTLLPWWFLLTYIIHLPWQVANHCCALDKAISIWRVMLLIRMPRCFISLALNGCCSVQHASSAQELKMQIDFEYKRLAAGMPCDCWSIISAICIPWGVLFIYQSIPMLSRTIYGHRGYYNWTLIPRFTEFMVPHCIQPTYWGRRLQTEEFWGEMECIGGGSFMRFNLSLYEPNASQYLTFIFIWSRIISGPKLNNKSNVMAKFQLPWRTYSAGK